MLDHRLGDKMEDEQFKKLIEKLNSLIALMAENKIKGKEYGEKVIFLWRFGLEEEQIAKILEKTPKQIKDVIYDKTRRKR